MAAKKTSELTEELTTLELRTTRIEESLAEIKDLIIIGRVALSEPKEETPSEASLSPEVDPAPGGTSIKTVTDHILANFHSTHLKPRDRHDLELLLRLYLYEEHFSQEDRDLLLRRLQHYAIVVSAGWKAAVSNSQRALLEICGVTLQAGDIAPQYPKKFYKARQQTKRKGGGKKPSA